MMTLAALPGMAVSWGLGVNLHRPGDILNFALRWNPVSVPRVLALLVRPLDWL
jgi:hypothetical protein